MTFRAIYLEKDDAGRSRASVRTLDGGLLSTADGTVTIDVAYSTINYKDALALTGRAPVVRRFPMVPGIDLSGTVVNSRSPLWQSGDEILLNGWGAGENWWGGLAERASVKAEWLIRKPATMTPYDVMAVGTAGYTAALCVMAIEAHGVEPASGEVLVTGATGGVGSLAILLLSAIGYRVVASTGKLQEADYLRRLGAADVIHRDTLAHPGKALQTERWAASVDSLGADTLANVCASTRANGVVTACGMAQGLAFPGSVAPFILRGITLVGINSVEVPLARRVAAWNTIERLIDPATLRSLSREIGLVEAIDAAQQVLAGAHTGRLVVNVEK